MTEDAEKPVAGFESLIQSLAKATGLSEDMAQTVVETAVDYVKAQRPDKAGAVDQALADEATGQKMGQLVEKMARKVPKPKE